MMKCIKECWDAFMLGYRRGRARRNLAKALRDMGNAL